MVFITEHFHSHFAFDWNTFPFILFWSEFTLPGLALLFTGTRCEDVLPPMMEIVKQRGQLLSKIS
jgi:hypothetical protein